MSPICSPNRNLPRVVVCLAISGKKVPIGAIVADRIQVVLDDAHAERMRVYADPIECVVAREPSDVSAALAAMEAARVSGKCLAGYLSYEFGYVLEPKLARFLPSKRGVPLLWFGVFDDVRSIQGGDVEAYLRTNISGRAYASSLKHVWDETAYGARFDRVHDLIEAGDIYQANLSYRSRLRFVGDPWALYRDLRAQSNAAHGAFVFDGERHILSLSPELFFRISSEGRIVAKPMKGTAPRGENEQSDAQLRRQLAESPKERAENLMIVDLLRNDIGKIAEMGSVHASDLFAVESYPTLHQMVSTVSAHLRPSQSIAQIIGALFPCGSVTGTPKIRAMELLAELETGPRGIYCGAIGYFAPDGSAEFNVAIRTLTISNGCGELGIGSAVVHDSNAGNEFSECLLKARYYEVTRQPLELVETMHFSPSLGFVRIDRHLARMQRSAEAFSIPFCLEDVQRALELCAVEDAVDLRVRLSLSENGQFACAKVPVLARKPHWTYVVSSARTLSTDELLRHKTSWRELYEAELAKARSCDEVLFLNELGNVTEGTRSNVFVRCVDRLCTPPISDGLLGGCLREELIAQGLCIERSMTMNDLEDAREIYFGNSLRGLIPAQKVVIG